ncbi:hypothetical protein Mycch_2570 [Mycolicibacterium chubuense NBB4]|uniref:Uncharacterized protein n=1 Tax=Mycolicibacterium chubuense (strain NBB4) TaxID=710421 RepID=I4BJ85_MYCCN|nr:hypothetical protein [Mycolicibacterium chubuense]AFM17342.1 hypothetical protein Mycch_2570 [Mycolicibacterium chubuense NBB4]
MMLKFFAATCLAGMIAIGAVALAHAAPNQSPASPYMTHQQPTPTTTTSNAPTYSGRTGY